MFKLTINVGIIVWIFSAKYLTVSSQSSCVSPWEQQHQSCVQFVRERSTWQDARNSCLSMNSDLLSVNSGQEYEFVAALVNRYRNSSSLKWWIGIREVNSTWLWVDNEQEYTNIPEWAPGIRWNDTIIENRCGLLEYQGYLLPRNCKNQRFFICEQTTTTQPPQTNTISTTPLSTKTLETTTVRTTTYPVPTPDTGTPRPPVTNSTEKPGDKSTTNHSYTESPTQRTTNRPTEGTTDGPVTGIPTDNSTGRSTNKTTTAHLTDSPTGSSTDNTVTERPSERTTSNSSAKETTEHLTDSPTETSTDNTATERSSESTTRKSSNKETTEHLTDSPTETSSGETGRPSDDPTGKPSTAQPTTENPRDEFLGCFAVNREDTCPPVEAFGISWPRSEAGQMINVSCNKGNTKWYCDQNPICWRDEPDVSQCTSESIQELTNQMEDFLSNTSNSEKAIEFTENLVASVESDAVMSEQDIFQSTKLMDAASQAKPKNSSEAKSIIKNVAKFGSGLVDKKDTWTAMTVESRRSVASSLLNSMESVTNNMLKSFNESTNETIVEENMVIELQVIDVNDDEPETNGTMFQADSNSFAITQETLKRFSTDGMAKLVFINYNTVGEFLVPVDDVADDNLERQMISQVISASLSEKSVEEPLDNTVQFTMKTLNIEKSQERVQLCSFWNFSLGYTGAWSQKGCTLKEYNNTHTTCQCNHLTNFAILMDVHSTEIEPIHAITLSYITYAGLIISIICLFFSWITFVCLRSIQGERNSIHKNLAFCLFIAEVLFLAGIERTDNKVACAIIAGFLHYFFLSAFTWMFVEGIHIVFMLVQVFDAARSRLKYYYMIGYGAPLLVVGISALVYYEGYGTEKYCWLTTDRMFIWSFAGPIVFILLVNLVVLIYAMFAVYKHSEYVFTKDKSKTGNIKAWIQGALAMEVLLGLTWIFGYFYISEEAIPVAYLFTIFNSLQGLFIFVFHCLLNKKVRKAYTRFIDYPGRTSSSGTHSTKAYHRGSGPPTPSYHMNGNRKHSKFLDLTKDRRPSSMSTTSA
ncbi:adhesion G protein-coupled receptor L4-like isoform X2 [Mercenaria mercenaria]|uniref:adhesion G protein-coupled receptor L4-like isoform X2 n=1 Tax=Mercenaria mercenaria TaxID=6596 RepID=UPI00234F0C29|nr:adhesion G protein-coupled receptor L4-like isoform X2 [Mercenaria mercenaria]